MGIISLTIICSLCYIAIIFKKKTNRIIDIICFTAIPCVLFALLVCVIGYYLFVINNWLFQSKHDGFAGNFIGGVIGGIVALIIAKSQVRLNIIEKNSIQKKQVHAFFVSLKTELKYNYELLKKIISNTGENDTIVELNNRIPFATETWEIIKLSPIFIDKVREDFYINLSDLYYDLSILMNSNIKISEKALKELYQKIEILISKIEELG